MYPVWSERLFGSLARVCLVSVIISALLIVYAPATAAEKLVETPAKSQSGKNRLAIIYVIDESSSMNWIMDDLKQILKQAIMKSGPDDCISIVLFGDTVTTLGCFKSMDEPRKARVSKLIDSICANSLYTNLDPAIGRGAEYLYDYFRARAADKFIMVLVTDGRDHPPPSYIKEHTLEQEITQHSNFIPGKQWSLRYIALKGELDRELKRLVEKYQGSFFDVEEIGHASKRTAGEVIDSIISVPDEWEAFDAVIVDQVGEVSVRKSKRDTWRLVPKNGPQRVSSGNQIAVGPHSMAVLGLGPNGKVGLKGGTRLGVQNLLRSPLKKSAMVSLALDSGTIWNAVGAPPDNSLSYQILSSVALTTVTGTILRVAFDGSSQEQSTAVLKGSINISPLKKQFEILQLNAGDSSLISVDKKPSLPGPIPMEAALE